MSFLRILFEEGCLGCGVVCCCFVGVVLFDLGWVLVMVLLFLLLV